MLLVMKSISSLTVLSCNHSADLQAHVSFRFHLPHHLNAMLLFPERPHECFQVHLRMFRDDEYLNPTLFDQVFPLAQPCWLAKREFPLSLTYRPVTRILNFACH